MMMMRLNFVHPDPNDPDHMSDRYRAGIDIAEHVDKHRFAMITLEEHQATPIGWSPTPLINAAMILARTEKITVGVTALLLPLHDPIRCAEQLAVLDLASRGRISITTGLGYRPAEYAALDREWKRRGKILDHALDTMMKAWTGEPFEYNGETIQVGPRPFTRPHPMVLIGGSSPAAARRAARLGLPLQMPIDTPDVEALYHEELEKHGNTGFCYAPESAAMVHVVEDPDRAWAELGHHFWLEASTYDSWQPEGQTSAVHTHADDIEGLRAEGIYRFLTPTEAVEHCEQSGALALHPLVGGMPIDSAWESVQLTTDKVLPALSG